jgi:hypothetical protein
VDISFREIERLSRELIQNFSLSVYTYEDWVELGKEFALMPRSPYESISFSNTIIVPKAVKRKLLKAFKLDGCRGYLEFLDWAEKCQQKAIYKPSILHPPGSVHAGAIGLALEPLAW